MSEPSYCRNCGLRAGGTGLCDDCEREIGVFGPTERFLARQKIIARRHAYEDCHEAENRCPPRE